MADDATIARIAANLLWFLPAPLGTALAFFLIVPKTKAGFAAFLCGSVGSAVYLGPVLQAASAKTWVPLSEPGAMFIMAALGVLIFQVLAAGIRKIDVADIANGWLKKGS